MIEEELFAVPVQAEADGRGEVAPGAPNALLVFVLAATSADARSRAGGGLFSSSEWTNVKVGEAAPVILDPEAMDEPLRSAALHAAQHGFSVVVYGPDADA